MIKKLLLCLPLLFPCLVQAQSYVQTYTGASSAGTTVQTTFTIPSGCSPSCSATVLTYDDNNYGGTFTPAFTSSGTACPSSWVPFYGGEASLMFLTYAEGLTTAGTCTVTATFSPSPNQPKLIMAVVANGLVPSLSLDGPPTHNFASSGTSLSTSLTTSGTSDYILGFVGNNCTGTATASGWTVPDGTGTATVSSSQYTLQAFGQVGGAATYTLAANFSCALGHASSFLIAYRSVLPTLGWLGTVCTVNGSATTVSNAISGMPSGALNLVDLWDQYGDGGGFTEPIQTMTDDLSDAPGATPTAFRGDTVGHYQYTFPNLASGNRTFTSTITNAQQWHMCSNIFKGLGYVWNATWGKPINATQYQTNPLTLPAGTYTLFASVTDTINCGGVSNDNFFSAPGGWTKVYTGPFNSCGQFAGPIRNAWVQTVTYASPTTVQLTITNQNTGSSLDGNGTLFITALSATAPANPSITQAGNSGGIVSAGSVSLYTQVPVKSGQTGVLLVSTNGACGYSSVPTSTVANTGWTLRLGDIGPVNLTAYSTASNVVTLTAANGFVGGEGVQFNISSGPAYLNNQYAVVLPNPTNTQFQVAWTGATGSGSASGTASPQYNQITAYSTASNIVTLIANNGFYAGQVVALTISSGPTYLNGQSLAVLSSGLSGTQFQVAWSGASGSGAAVGTAQIAGFIGVYTTTYTAGGSDQVQAATTCNTSAQYLALTGVGSVGPRNYQDCGQNGPGSCSDNGITLTQNNSLVLSTCHAFASVSNNFTWSNATFQWVNDAGSHDSGTLSLVAYQQPTGAITDTCSNVTSGLRLGASIISFGPSSSAIVQPVVNLITRADPEQAWRIRQEGR